VIKITDYKIGDTIEYKSTSMGHINGTKFITGVIVDIDVEYSRLYIKVLRCIKHSEYLQNIHPGEIFCISNLPVIKKIKLSASAIRALEVLFVNTKKLDTVK